MKKLDFDILGIRCYNLLYAYNQSIESGLNHINFYDSIPLGEVSDIVAICRANKFKYITLTCNQIDYPDLIDEFMECGCKFSRTLEYVPVRGREKPIPAFKILL